MKQVAIDSVQNKWYVTWPDMGELTTDALKWRLIRMIVEEVKPFEFGLGRNLEQYNQSGDWFVQWFSLEMFSPIQPEEYDTMDFTPYLRQQQGRSVDGVMFHRLDDAELFVEVLEKHLTFIRLKHF